MGQLRWRPDGDQPSIPAGLWVGLQPDIGLAGRCRVVVGLKPDPRWVCPVGLKPETPNLVIGFRAASDAGKSRNASLQDLGMGLGTMGARRVYKGGRLLLAAEARPEAYGGDRDVTQSELALAYLEKARIRSRCGARTPRHVRWLQSR